MKSQVLGLHRVTPRCYDITTVRTGSVRDQILRATFLAHALFDTKILALESRLLVFGAGVTGIALALSAARLGANVVVLEFENVPFSTLRSGKRRIVDPTEFDWPQAHFGDARLPLLKRSALISSGHLALSKYEPVLTLQRSSAKNLCDIWTAAYLNELLPAIPDSIVSIGAGSIQILYGRNAREVTIRDHSAQISSIFTPDLNQPRGNVDPKDYPTISSQNIGSHLVSAAGPYGGSWSKGLTVSAVVSCIGFGQEITQERFISYGNSNWNGYRGPVFWSDDDGMLSRGFALSSTGTKPSNILISGGGDGAMQDFQRAATGTFGRDLLERLTSSAPRYLRAGQNLDPERYTDSTSRADDRARRALALSPLGRIPDYEFSLWHQPYEKAVDNYLLGYNLPNWSGSVLRRELVEFLAGNQRNTTSILWIRESSFGHSYPLNRFLSLVIARMIDSLKQSIRSRHVGLLLEHEISSIAPIYHQCGSASGCYGRDHVVGIKSTVTGTTFNDRFNLMLIRHGQMSKEFLGGSPVPEQQVPYDIPT